MPPQELLDLDPNDVIVERESRQRRVIDTDAIQESIQRIGQIQPIVVTEAPGGKHLLIAGERRLISCRNLGLRVKAVDFSSLSPSEQQLVELEENLKRKNLTWQDEAAAVARVHQLYADIAAAEGSAEWTMSATAERLSISPASASIYLRLARELEGEAPGRLAESKTLREAYNVASRKDQRAAELALEDLMTPVGASSMAVSSAGHTPPSDGETAITPPPPQPESIHPADFLSWLPSYTGPRFNFIHCDFPYGISVFSGPQAVGSEPIDNSATFEGARMNGTRPKNVPYNDAPDVYWTLLQALVDNIDKIAATSCHLMFWYSETHGPRTRQLLTAAGFKVQTHPLIWLKTDNVGVAADTSRRPRHVYETALLASRGDRRIVQVKADAYAAPTAKQLHPSCKPVPVLRHFFAMLVDDSTSMLDPTCGSGTSLVAAESMGAKQVLGFEKNPQFAEIAQRELRKYRRLKSAGASAGAEA